MATKSTNWIVLFQPRGEITVATMRVIDAWASTSSAKKDAERTMKSNMEAYREKFGDGHVYVVSTYDSYRL